MRALTPESFGRWTRDMGLVALVAFAGAALVPGGVFRGAVLAAGLVGSTVATALLVRSRSVLSLAQVIGAAEAEPVVAATRIGIHERS